MVPAAAEPLRIEGPEQSRVDPALPDAGLPPLPGVHSFQVFRASQVEHPDGPGYTYHHHVDLACWKGRLYLGWNSCRRDEDVWPSRELYSTSADGIIWSEPQEMFPQGLSTPLRMYFYHARNGRMLMFAGLRASTANTDEDTKGSLVVREILPDHSLGQVYALRTVGPVASHPPLFDHSPEPAFIAACRELLDNRPFLEQQDRGRLLGERRMKWHDASAWPGGTVPGDDAKWVAGKAYSFFPRPDGVLVGVSKMGWVTTTADDGEHWTQPVVPPSLVTGKAKVWAQRTRDGRYVLVYNPSTRNRFPLVLVSSDDGVSFRDMRIVQGELPVQRYAGEHRSIGPQYVRGISHWADDGSRAGDAVWVAYSMNKEDLWVSRIPLPVQADPPPGDVCDDFSADGPLVPGWNIYRPCWTEVAQAGGGLVLRSREPYDYAAATRAFAARSRVTVSFDLLAAQNDCGTFEIDLLGTWGSPRPVRIRLSPEGELHACNGASEVGIGRYSAGQWLSVRIDADANRSRFSVEVDGRSVLVDASFAAVSADLQRISFRTGAYRGIGGAHPVAPESDRPGRPIEYQIRRVRIFDPHKETA